MRVPPVEPSQAWCVAASGPRGPSSTSVSARPRGGQVLDRRVAGGRVEVADHQPRQRRVEPPEERLRAAQPRDRGGAVPVQVREAERRAGPQVGEAAEGDDPRDRVAPRPRGRQPRRVGEPAHGPALEPQTGAAVDHGAALAAAAAVVAAGSGAGVALQPARQPALLEEAHLLQADDVGVEATTAAAHAPARSGQLCRPSGLRPVRTLKEATRKGGGRKRPPAAVRVASRGAGHPTVRLTWGSGCARTCSRPHCSRACGAACRPCGRTRSRKRPGRSR